MNSHSDRHGLSVARRARALVLLVAALGAGLWPARIVPASAFQDEPPPRTQSDVPPPEREPVPLGTHTLASGAAAAIIEFPVVADAYIASGRPNQNFGAGALFLGYNLDDGFGAQRIVLRFDLGGIPANAVVHDARLRLYLIYGSPPGDAPMGTIVRRLASTWGEHAVTWNSEPTWASIRDESSVGTTMGWYEWNITDLTTAWVQDAVANQGVEVQGDENVQQRERAFYSRETTTPFYPRLVVTYSVVDDNQPPSVNIVPLPAYSPREFTVSWTGSDQGPAGLSHYDVQYQVDGGAWVNWQTGVTSTSAEFVGVSGHTYGFRARGVDNVGNTEPYGAAEAQTLVDARPPEITVNPLPAEVTADPFTVSWSGTDPGGSGVQHYDVRYQFNGAWIEWLNNTTATSAAFTATEDGAYAFEARGTDNAGQVEPFTGQAEASTYRDIVAPFLEPILWLPIIFR